MSVLEAEEQEILLGFVAESRDLLDEVEPDLISLGNIGPDEEVDKETINAIFRLFHSMKGSAGFLGLKYLAGVTHEAETLLDYLRKDELRVHESHIDLFGETCDFLRNVLDGVEETLSDDDFAEEAYGFVEKYAVVIGSSVGNSSPTESDQQPTEEPKVTAKKSEPQKPEKPKPNDKVVEEMDNLEFVITPEMISHFVQESDELLNTVEQSLMSYEQDPENRRDQLDEAFRAIHSFKGNCGFFSYGDLEKVSHKIETALDCLRNGLLLRDDSSVSLLLTIMDSLKEAIIDIDNKGDGKVQGYLGLIGIIDDILPSNLDELATIKEQNDTIDVVQEEPEETFKRFQAKESGEPEQQPEQDQEPQDAASEESDNLEFVITPEMISHFVQESDELLNTVEQSLMSYEEDPENRRDQLDEAFRAIHSFKGNCGFFSYGDLEKVSHKIETALDCLRNGLLLRDDSAVSLLLHIMDSLKEGIIDIDNKGDGKVQGYLGLIGVIDDILPSNLDELATIKELNDTIDVVPENPEETFKKFTKSSEDEASDIDLSEEPDSEVLEAEDVGIEPVEAEENEELYEESALPDIEEEPETLPVENVDQDKPAATAMTAKTTESKQNGKSQAAGISTIKSRDIRVDVSKLDRLINLVGELVIAEAMVTKNPDLSGLELENFERAAHGLNLITTDLQDVAMSIRMIPISGTFRKMIRLVHDLSRKSGKKAKLELVGEETEVDKNVCELIADPLVHIVRNSVDHGLELPEVRKNSNKSPEGLISIEARHEGGEVWVIIKDDGNGLDREKILKKAAEKGMVNGDGADLSDDEVFKMIFEPGFSTAERVSDVSGRGVGMDVVKKNIEKLKGRIDIHSKAQKGTTIILRIPLTLAVIEGMLLRVGNTRYTVPTTAIREFFRPVLDVITVLQGGEEVVKLRDEILPVVRLHELHDKKPDNFDLQEGIVVVIESQNSRLGLFVDEVLGQQQTVIKGLSEYIGNVEGVSGCTILGDGEVSLILDIGTLVPFYSQPQLAN